MTTLFYDSETFCATPIKFGVYKYAEQVELMIVTYAIDDGPVRCWDVMNSEQDDFPGDLYNALTDSSVTVVAHNAQFDRTVLRHVFPEICPPVERWHCTMAQALAHSLPGGLGKLGEVFKLPEDEQKMKEGRELLMMFCKPRPKNSKVRRFTRATHPEQWAKFLEYAGSDITAMRQIFRKLPTWNWTPNERDLWCLDQKMNDRGVGVDLELCRKAIVTVDIAQKKLAERTTEITNGAVEKTTQRDKLLAYILAEEGVELPDLQAATLERRLQDESLPATVRELIAIRLQASTSSTSKYQSMINAANADNRVRGMIQFCGAARTGRYSHRIVQLGNLPRPNLKPAVIENGIDAIKLGAADLICDNVMELCSNAIRGFIAAPPGRKLNIADLANIEGRFAAWVANEKWKLQAFREYDAGTGPDLYRVAYARAFAVGPDDVDGFQRQIGKVMELFLQYEGGVGAFITGADTYGVDLVRMTETAMPTIPEDVLAEARGFLAWLYQDAEKRHARRLKKGEDVRESTDQLEAAKLVKRFGLDEEVFLACDSLKRMWRRRHPAIVSFWGEIKGAIIQCVEEPGKRIQVGRVAVVRQGAWLRIILPSGRSLSYPAPRVTNNSISYLGVNPYTKQWGRIKSYGGKFLENICQGGSRDVMTANMPMIEDLGYEICLTVHDEVATETPDTDEFSGDKLGQLMATSPSWATGMPLAAKGHSFYRYQKAD